MKETSKRRLFMAGAIGVAGIALATIAFGNIGENLVYYWDPSDLQDNADKAIGASIRLGGMVQAGTVQWMPEANALAFKVTDGQAIVPVEATGAPPQMFREGIGVVVEGTMTETGTFKSDRLMVKHSNEYRAPHGEMTPEERKKLYDSILDGDAQ